MTTNNDPKTFTEPTQVAGPWVKGNCPKCHGTGHYDDDEFGYVCDCLTWDTQ